MKKSKNKIQEKAEKKKVGKGQKQKKQEIKISLIYAVSFQDMVDHGYPQFLVFYNS